MTPPPPNHNVLAEPRVVARPVRRLGCLPPKSDPRALMFGRYAAAPPTLPKATRFWRRRAPFRIRSFGNLQHNDCTIAKQAIAHMRMERLETRRTPEIDDAEVVRVYRDLCRRLYGGGDYGAYETDALSNWRRPEHTFRDTQGRPLTIDAYTRVNHNDQRELRQAIWTAASHGIAVCVNLPRAFDPIDPPGVWDLPEGQRPIGDWLPGTWGGHSMWARDYDEQGIWLVHTWNQLDQLLTWRAAAVYLVEAHLVIDSMNAWRKTPSARRYDLGALKRDVNKVSSQKIA